MFGGVYLWIGQDLVTPWYDAPKLKIVEQAAAEALLQQLPDEPATQPQPTAATNAPAPASNNETQAGSNAAIALNELRQAGILQASGYETIDQTGPSHQPTFSVVAWATTPEGQTTRTEPVSGGSKKSAQRAAAARLLERLVAKGITGQ